MKAVFSESNGDVSESNSQEATITQFFLGKKRKKTPLSIKNYSQQEGEGYTCKECDAYKEAELYLSAPQSKLYIEFFPEIDKRGRKKTFKSVTQYASI